jgi:hypothetical protein
LGDFIQQGNLAAHGSFELLLEDAHLSLYGLLNAV